MPKRRTSRRSRAEPTAHTISGSFSRQLLMMPGSRPRATGAVTSLATAFLVATPASLAATFSPVRRPKAANFVGRFATASLAAAATPTATITAQTDPAGHENKKTKGVCGEMRTSSPNCTSVTSGHKPRTAASSTHVCEVNVYTRMESVKWKGVSKREWEVCVHALSLDTRRQPFESRADEYDSVTKPTFFVAAYSHGVVQWSRAKYKLCSAYYGCNVRGYADIPGQDHFSLFKHPKPCVRVGVQSTVRYRVSVTMAGTKYRTRSPPPPDGRACSRECSRACSRE